MFASDAPEGPWKQVFASGNFYLRGVAEDRIFSPYRVPGWCDRNAGTDAMEIMNPIPLKMLLPAASYGVTTHFYPPQCGGPDIGDVLVFWNPRRKQRGMIQFKSTATSPWPDWAIPEQRAGTRIPKNVTA